MNPRRSFLRGLVAGIVLGVASSLPGLSRVPVKPERPKTAVERVVCAVCGLDSGSLMVEATRPEYVKAARLATKVLRSQAAEAIEAGDCPQCPFVREWLNYEPHVPRGHLARLV